MGSRNQARNNTRRLFESQNGRCFYCDVEMFLMANSTKQDRKENRDRLATFDHIRLKSDGGTYALHNGVCACFKCNGMRGNLPQDVFIANFDFISAEWDKKHRHAIILNGAVTCIGSKKRKRMEKTRIHRAAGIRKGGYILARYALQIGKTVEDLFLENVYNSTYDMVRDL